MPIQFDQYDVTVQIIDRLVGGIPIVPEGADRADAYERWAAGQGIESPTDRAELAAKLAEDEEMPVALSEVEGLETGFRRDEEGLYIEARQVNAMLREAAQRLGIVKRVRGSRQVLQHDLHVRALDGSQKIRFDRAEPDGKDQRPISVVTRQGPRTAIKRFEYVNRPTLRFRVLILTGGVGDGLIGHAELADMLDLGGMLGLGADRSQGEGTFEVTEVRQPAKG